MGKQPTTGQKKSKTDIAKAAQSRSKGPEKKKWVKGKNTEQLNLAVFYDKNTYDRLIKDVPAMKLVTVATVADRLKINGSMARVGIRHLAEKKLIKPCGEQHSSIVVYTGAKEVKPVEPTGKEAAKDTTQQKGKGKQAPKKEETAAQ